MAGAAEAGTPSRLGRFVFGPLLIHACAAVVVLTSALAARLPFVPFYDAAGGPPAWGGTLTAWGLGGLAYVLVWTFASAGNRLAEVLLAASLMLASAGAGFTLLNLLLQAVGLAVHELRFTSVWWLSLIGAAATIGGFLALLSLQRHVRADRDDGLDRPPLVPSLPRFVPAVLVVALVGALVFAWSTALFSPPRGNPQQAVEAVRRQTAGVDAKGLIPFQDGVAAAVKRAGILHRRDGWSILDARLAGGDYSTALQWGQQVLWRSEVICVASDVATAEVVVLPGACPR